MDSLEAQTIGQIVASDYRKADIFKEFGIDFSCRGHITVEAVCKQHGIKPDKLLAAFEDLNNEGAMDDSYNNWSLDILVDYIVNNHHQYLRESLPEIEFYAKTVENIYGDTHRELLRIYVELLKLSDEMEIYMEREEKRLFPFIKRLVSDKKYSNRDEEINSSEIIASMQNVHQEVGKTLTTIRELSNYYKLPANASTTYTKFYKNLTELDEDLHKHLHLENNILFPKVLELG